jgi:hypothetical protein
MSAAAIARRHFEAARNDALASGESLDSLARTFLSLAIETFLEKRSVADVRSELIAAADNVDPDTDYVFMRP